MKIIKVQPTEKRPGAWESHESDGVRPFYLEKQKAIDYACQRFGGFSEGEVHVYANDGLTIERVITIDGGSSYSSVSHAGR